ncbi:MAG: NUDIX domain-containing protein [Candidatus Paceibacterota bacterium]
MERPKTEATVVLLVNESGQVCLARKKQAIHHESGEIEYSLGLYNGYGGKKEDIDGDIFDTAIRELHDESGVNAKKEDLDLAFRAYFYIQKEETTSPFMTVSFFFLHTWSGDMVEGREMGPPLFFAPQDMPYEEMMPADKILFEKMLSGDKFVAEVLLLGKHIAPEITFIKESLAV